MSKRTIYFGTPCYISCRSGQLVVKDQDDKIISGQLPVEDIGYVVLDHQQITITHKAIQELIYTGAVIISCTDRHLPAGMMLDPASNSMHTMILREQMAMSEALKKQLWKQIVEQKIKNQMQLITHEECSMRMDYLRRTVRSGDPENKEAQAASWYWRHWLPEFIRDRDGEEPNHLLNYGYAILRAVVARALVTTGFHCAQGIHHRNKYNAYCLADDIMEPYRPYVDRLVLQIVQTRDDVGELHRELKSELLSIVMTDVQMGKSTRPLSMAVTETSASFLECIRGQRRKLKLPSMD